LPAAARRARWGRAPTLVVGAALAGVGGAALLGLMAGPAGAQTVEGRVVDAATDTPLAGATLTLRNERGVREDRGESARDGGFRLAARNQGPHSLEVTRPGFEPVTGEVLQLALEVLEVEVRLSRAPIELAPIIVTGRRRDARHDASFEGALARHQIFPRVGTRRVVLREDTEFRSAMVVADVLRWFPARRGCTIVYSNGVLARSEEWVADLLNRVSTETVEAVEFYRQWGDAPLELKDVPPYVSSPTECSVVALWPRVSGPPPAGLTWGRALRVGTVLGTLFLGIRLLGGS